MFVRDGAVWSQQAHVEATNIDGPQSFGSSVELSGDGSTLAVGYTSNVPGGAVYMFARNEDVWSEQAYVKASNPETGDGFGCSVGLSGNGDTMVVGATWEDSNATGIDGDQANNLASDSGAAYVFVRNGGVWSEQAYVKAPDTEEYGAFGDDVARSDDGDTMAVFREVDPFDYHDGAAYVFARNGGVWPQQVSFGVPFTILGGFLGPNVALSSNGDIMAIGAHGETGCSNGIARAPYGFCPVAGAVYVYVRNDDTWSSRAYVKASSTFVGSRFGGNTMSVGSSGETSSATGIGGDQSPWSVPDAGAVYLY